MFTVKVDKTDTCSAHCEQGDFDLALGDEHGLNAGQILNRAALHSMETGHDVKEDVHSEMKVHPV